MNLDSKIYVAGHQGLVGSALMQKLMTLGYKNLVTRTFSACDLRDQKAVNDFFTQEKPEYVFLAAARVGGIHANNTRPAEFIYDNLAIQLNVIDAAYKYRVKKLLFLGSSCIYPRNSEQPIQEKALLTGPLEPTNAPYALAKISGIAMCQAYNKQYGANFISAMPTNLYGPGDNFDTMQAHVIPSLIAKFCDAILQKKAEVIVWGTGNAYREFLYVDDCADALVFLMNNYQNSEIINIGVGHDIKIHELVYTLARLTGFQGQIIWDNNFPDGTPRKRLDVTKIHGYGWHAQTDLENGLIKTIQWYKKQKGITRENE
ncbi:MAG: GDP-L-fucose synthase [Candidatus Babeliaceae bacterium]|nr:GDP-L-fucose synthase [Candidatus Babeliaceae bacterium]